MNIPRYWARVTGQAPVGFGKVYDLAVWGWSSEDRAGAERKAQERLAAFTQRVQQGLDLPRGYAYGDRPLRSIDALVQSAHGYAPMWPASDSNNV